MNESIKGIGREYNVNILFILQEKNMSIHTEDDNC